MTAVIIVVADRAAWYVRIDSFIESLIDLLVLCFAKPTFGQST